MITKYLILIVSVALGFAACSNQSDKSLEIKNLVEEYANNHLFNGSIAIGNNDSIIFMKSYGYSNIENKELINSSTPFPIASVTKQFTATAIMILHESGKLSINDEIEKFIDVPTYMESVKIRNLMNHTSGIPDYWQNDIENHDDSINQFLNCQDSLLFHPNTSGAYSNSGYYLLGKIIEYVSDTTYAAFINEHIFKPLGMTNSFVYNGKECSHATGYNLNWKINEYFFTTADGGIISSIDDLTLWNKSLVENTIIKAETKNLMFQPVELEDGTSINNGFGWVIGLNQVSLFDHLIGTYKGVVSHTGALSSFGAYNQYDTNNNLHVILLSNQLRPELMDLITKINKVLY